MATSTAVKAANPYELLARREKVERIVVFIWAGMSAEQRRDFKTPWLLLCAGETIRLQLAKGAGAKRAPSDETWSDVAEGIARLVNAERQGATEPCDYEHCKGGSVYAGNGDELTCPDCLGFSARLCEYCGEAPGTVATPHGLYDERCAKQVFPGVVA